MYTSKRFRITRKNSLLYQYCKELSHNYKNMYNVANFYIRQVMTGVKKSVSERQSNEKEALDIIERYLPKYNDIRRQIYIKKNGSDAGFKEVLFPTEDKWFLNAYTLDAVFKLLANPDYQSLPAQVNTAAISECCASWSDYFKALKKYKTAPDLFTGKPRIPKYLKSQHHTVKLTNQICKLHESENKTYLRFPKTKAKLWLGSYISPDADLKQIEIKPVADFFEIILIIDESETIITQKAESERIIGIDLGIDNFATITNNVSLPSVIIKGNMIKSRNQWYNKEYARLKSILTLGHESDKHQQSSKRIQNLWAKRTRYMRDYMHKMSCAVIQYCIDNNIDTIVIGKNDGWKTNSNMGHVNNQNFVQIPYEMFIEQLAYKANRHGIRVIAREESYTSKASFLDMDNIPDYDSNNQIAYIFSGKRTKRGLYVSGKGISINADVNGSANIIRKEFPDAFLEMDIMYVRKTQTWNERKWYTSKTA